MKESIDLDIEKINIYYEKVIGVDLTDMSHPISKKIDSIKNVTEEDKKIKLHHLTILGLSLMVIKEYDVNVYDYYLKRIANNSDISIHGHIFEIKQCFHFIEAAKNENLKFKFGDANLKEPDFVINELCGFEITSIRFSDSSVKVEPGKKLLNKFREKNAKTYANSNTALIVDISQATYQTFEKGLPVTQSLDDVIKIMKNEMKFGVVLCLMEWIEIVNDELNSKGTVYFEFSENCGKELKEIIEKKFVKGRIHELNNNIFIASN
jgi:hypothetical protein